jgi:hypothetical protein
MRKPKIFRKHPPSHLDELLESSVERRADVGDVLPEIDSGKSALRYSFRGEFKLLQWCQYCSNISNRGCKSYLVNILVSTGSTKSVKTELFVSISFPAHG